MVETMNLQVTGMWWSRLTQVLAALGVVASVFAMHGLTVITTPRWQPRWRWRG
jgi:hypothetical protein